ncbi:MAG: response regulator [Acidobacteria bacterium]|nr:response regulator [Acidobacteriota bacterium]
MKESDEPGHAAEVPHQHNSILIEAIQRVGASLDVTTVLREAVDSTRTLTGARYSVITTVDEAGLLQDFVTSGLTAEEERRLTSCLPDGLKLFEHLREQQVPLRVDDFPGHIRALGLAPELGLCRTFQGTPMHHRGVHVGTFFVGDKEGGKGFSDEDEALLMLFASQAAVAIANARTHREERRARAGFEALVETSPVGVVVFDANTAMPVTVNREARRLGETLGGPGLSATDLIEEVTSRLSDGREVTFNDYLKSAGTVRNVEVEVSVPQGRSIRLLVNATPISSVADDVESVVVTLQDLAALDELERLRIEFLGMVSHELRSPLASIKGSTTTLLNAPRALDRAETRQFVRIIDQGADHMQGLIGDLLDAGRIHAGTLSVDPEPWEVAALLEQARTTFLSGGGRQAIRIDLPADLPRVMADERRIVQVLNNLFANAARHSPESSPIEVGAVRDHVEVAVSITDKGRGIPPERLPLLFRRYVDAGAHDGEDAGFGLGLVICKGLVEAHGGRIRAESAGSGLGTRFTFTLPAVEEAGAFAAAPRARGAWGEAAPVLVVDDDPETLRHVRDALAAAGYAPHVTGEPKEAARLVRTIQPQLVLLDLMLPGRDGIALMQDMPDLAELPVIFISGYGRDETIARALEAGAVDYIVKPFSATELTARVGAALRRRDAAGPFVLGELTLDHVERRVTVAGRVVELTPTEYALLRALSLNAGRVTTYESLLRQVWSERENTDVQAVRNFVKKLRRKLGDDSASPSWVLNVRGLGYRMPSPDEEERGPPEAADRTGGAVHPGD